MQLAHVNHLILRMRDSGGWVRWVGPLCYHNNNLTMSSSAEGDVDTNSEGTVGAEGIGGEASATGPEATGSDGVNSGTAGDSEGLELEASSSAPQGEVNLGGSQDDPRDSDREDDDVRYDDPRQGKNEEIAEHDRTDNIGSSEGDEQGVVGSEGDENGIPRQVSGDRKVGAADEEVVVPKKPEGEGVRMVSPKVVRRIRYTSDPRGIGGRGQVTYKSIKEEARKVEAEVEAEAEVVASPEPDISSLPGYLPWEKDLEMISAYQEKKVCPL